MEVFVMDIVTL